MRDARSHILVLLSSLKVGGIEKLALSLARALGDRFRFTAVAFDSGGSLAEEFRQAGAPARVLLRRQGVDVAYPVRLARLIREVGADLVHCHNETALFYGRLAALFARVGAVYTEHDRSFPSRQHIAVLNRALAYSCRGVVAVSGRLSEELTHYEKIPTKRIRVIRNGVDGAPFLGPDPRGEVRRELRIGDAERMVVSAGRLSPEKGFDQLVRAVPAVLHAVPGTVFVVAGDGPERERLRRAAGDVRILFLGERDDIPRLLRAADLVAIPSRSEGLPLIAVEAAAAARPTVAMDVGALSEIVVDGETGRLVPAGDVGALIGTICALLADPDLRRSMGGAAERRFRESFTIEHMAREYEKVYRLAIEGKGAA